MPLIHDVSRAIHILLWRSGTVYLCFFFFQNFIQNFKCNDDGALGDQKYISLMKWWALLAQWQSTGLVNQGSGVRSSYRAAFILEFFWFSYLIFKTIFCPVFCPLLKKTITIFYMAMKNVFIEQKVEIIYS